MADYKNAEGYPDPTAFGAFCAIEKEEKALRAFRPIVYICSPYAGDIETNTAAARRYCRFAVEAGYIPIAPHLLFHRTLTCPCATRRTSIYRWVLQIPTVKRINNCGLNTSSSLATRHNSNRFGF